MIVYTGIIPVITYGGTGRDIWYLGRELVKKGHSVSYLVGQGSSCDFAQIIPIDKSKGLASQIPDAIDVVSFHHTPDDIDEVKKPYVITIHGNCNDFRTFDKNTIFVSKNHAARFGSNSYIYNGMDWDDYGKPDFASAKNYFHFLGKAAWKVKNLKGAISVIKSTRHERLRVLGGHRFNINMGMRLTFSPRVRFHGMVGGEEKNRLLRRSKGLLFPVRWHEPMGLAVIESLYLGAPVFGTPYGSLPEIVNEQVGYLSNSKSDLVDAVENAGQYSGKLCHEYALENFNATVMTEAYIDRFQRVMNGAFLNKKPPKLVEKLSEPMLPWNP